MIGERIDHFEIREELGSGGMGEVFKAWDSKRGEEVALKIMHRRVNKQLKANPEELKRFKREVKILEKLNHTNVCPLYESGETSEGLLYIAMPCYEKQTLKEKLVKPLGLKEVLDYGKQIAEGLNYIHKQGVVHRDITPRNIFVTDFGVKIFDFGLSKIENSDFTVITESYKMMGTLGYMPLEQMEDSKHVNFKADIWAWGTVLFEMIVGEPPFGKGKMVLSFFISGKAVPRLSSFDYLPDNEYYKVLQGVLDKSLAKDIEDRYDSFEEPIRVIDGLLKRLSNSPFPEKPLSHSPFPEKPVYVELSSAEKIAKPMWASNFGNDNYGYYADLEYKGVVQRFRWIKAGEFWMGSPESEKERYNREIRHRVRLTQGFWMADTACTQALWEAVTGNNPSYFKGNDLPVENISWYEIKEFIGGLNGQVQELELRLPTEAEWEYACRAGTETPFAYGEKADRRLMNYWGDNNDKTVPVSNLYQNDWGLYQMHGNVWEWCEDWYGEYDTSNRITVDPRGPNTGSDRVLRGGSWSNVGRDCRSANRYDPSDRNDFCGFRLISGHPETE